MRLTVFFETMQSSLLENADSEKIVPVSWTDVSVLLCQAVWNNTSVRIHQKNP
jgi:hypothetical protein